MNDMTRVNCSIAPDLLFTLIDRIGEGVTLSDEHGRFHLYNAKMEEITGYSMEEAERCGDFMALLYPEPDSRTEERFGPYPYEVARTRGYLDAEVGICAKDGTRKTLLVSTSMVRHQEEFLFLSVYRDISSLKKAEEELRLALAGLKTSNRLLPVCAACNKVRNDHGEYQEIEAFVSEQFEVTFNHGICPACAKRLYPEHYHDKH